ncbi:hypothetical protein GBA52_019832 [Prunus armeniaca]|nr:hypothetical protein GBA52_019832 [Prunus armeniaca]
MQSINTLQSVSMITLRQPLFSARCKAHRADAASALSDESHNSGEARPPHHSPEELRDIMSMLPFLVPGDQ